MDLKLTNSALENSIINKEDQLTNGCVHLEQFKAKRKRVIYKWPQFTSSTQQCKHVSINSITVK